MCRHLAYLGAPRSVSHALTDGTHSLFEQSWAPTDMRCDAVMNADGWGVAWWPQASSAHAAAGPDAYRDEHPIWSDPAVRHTLTHVRATAIVAAVRSATVGMPISAQACAPFTDDGWAFSHNGVIAGWPQTLARLAPDVPVTEWMRTSAPTDSATLWTYVRHELAAGADPATLLSRVVTELCAQAPGSRLNLLLSDGDSVLATTCGHSLSVRHDADGVLIASEPTDGDPRWQPIDDHHLVVATSARVEITAL
ncbi:ergothioneine biosynthesis protein EgtC [Gordonia jinhuaensis]|uniref:Gamma-glutamyl-hercynylcysteine sulfoxide hydrolase n=1 Tax=Gordonia jinhuaensis TaxID=1517702 RepID=A0A916T9D2_9ACTN|nr:ergothioneine biosynthesis protein EgtC [Gordonia jinhuaensis]GGB35128.1 gamma-glutamyl-hercynylcysteine sulfoxide hydrolase [Gordonia jinhuaensis]